MYQYQKDRDLNLKLGSYIPGADTNFPLDYRQSAETKAAMPSGFDESEQMHHLVPAELFGAFVQNLTRQEAEIVINRANALGIRVANDPANFIGLDKLTEHLRNDDNPNTIHSRLDDIGLESSELAGEQRAQFYGLLNKIANSSVKTRLEALPDFVAYIAEPAIELGREYRPKAQGIEQNKAQYARELANEVEQEQIAFAREQAASAYGLPLVPKSKNSQNAAGGKDLTNLLKAVRNDKSIQDPEELKQVYVDQIVDAIRQAQSLPSTVD